MKTQALLATTVATTMLFAGSATAATVQLAFDDFENRAVARGISLDPAGTGAYTAVQAAAQNAAFDWVDKTNGYKASAATAIDQNSRVDVSGHDGLGGNAGVGMRVRSSTGAAVLKDAMQLSTLLATSVTISYDINLDDDSAFEIGLYFANNADFTDAIEITTWTSNGTANGGWFSESHTVNPGDVTGGFTDDSYFMLGRLSRGNGANSTFHSFDNVSVTAEVVPEPGSLALLGLGGLMIARRRRG